MKFGLLFYFPCSSFVLFVFFVVILPLCPSCIFAVINLYSHLRVKFSLWTRAAARLYLMEGHFRREPLRPPVPGLA
jgi:hypothetical protein